VSTTLLRPTGSVIVAGESVIPSSGDVTLDETATYAVANFTIPLLTLEQVDAIDPREGVRTVITLGGRPFDLGVRERTVDHAAKTIDIRAASDEELLDDYAPLADDTAPVAMASSIRAVVNYVLGVVIPGAALESTPANDAAVAEVDALTWQAGTTAWEFLLGIVTSASLRLFCDEKRDWRLVPSSYLIPGVVSAMPTNSKEGTDTLSRDGEAWVTGVVCIYEWNDGTTSQRRVDAAGVPGKVNVIRFSTPYPGPGAAAMRLNRLRGQGRTQTGTSFANYNASPGMEARFTLPGTFDQIGRLQKVTFPMLDGFMALGARELTEVPPTAYIFGDAGIAYDDVPVGMSYDEFDWEAI
jgi:hypothetical protein